MDESCGIYGVPYKEKQRGEEWRYSGMDSVIGIHVRSGVLVLKCDFLGFFKIVVKKHSHYFWVFLHVLRGHFLQGLEDTIKC